MFFFSFYMKYCIMIKHQTNQYAILTHLFPFTLLIIYHYVLYNYFTTAFSDDQQSQHRLLYILLI